MTGVLRRVLLGLGAALLAAGLWLGGAGFAPALAWRLAVPGFLLLAALLVERWRYRRLRRRRPGPEWLATDERFIDPESGRPVRVFYHPQTGERRYVED